MNNVKKLGAWLAAGLISMGTFPALSAESSTADSGSSKTVKVDFVRPSGWGGPARADFIPGDGRKYLRLVGDPERKNNAFYYAFYYMPQVQGGEEIDFTVSCKLEKLTAGKFRVGIYEFSNPEATKSIRFQSVEVVPSPEWQTISKKVKLHPETKRVRFYVLGQGAGKDDTLLVRELKFTYQPNR